MPRTYSLWLDVPGSTYPGSPVGCDSNADTIVDAGDLSCTYRLLFGLSCAGSTVRTGSEAPVVEMGPWEVPLEKGRAVSRLELHSVGHDVNGLVVSLDLDQQEHFAFDPTDADGDGLPGAIRFPGFVPPHVEARWDAADEDGELDLVITRPGLDASAAFPDRLDVEFEVQARDDSARHVRQPWRFSTAPSPSTGDVFGRSLATRAEIPVVGLFADGFESGGFDSWSAAVP